MRGAPQYVRSFQKAHPPVVLLGDQRPVPRQQRVRRHDRGNLAQQPSAECPGFRGEPTALIVGEAQAPGSEPFAQDAVLFLEIVDDITLLLVDPTSERDEKELQRMRQRRHDGQPTRGWVRRGNSGGRT